VNSLHSDNPPAPSEKNQHVELKICLSKYQIQPLFFLPSQSYISCNPIFFNRNTCSTALIATVDWRITDRQSVQIAISLILFKFYHFDEIKSSVFVGIFTPLSVVHPTGAVTQITISTDSSLFSSSSFPRFRSFINHLCYFTAGMPAQVLVLLHLLVLVQITSGFFRGNEYNKDKNTGSHAEGIISADPGTPL
jgi:hypothetical protein